MTGPAVSVETVDLQLQSLELDIKTLQRNRDEDRKEFQEFQAMVNRNFNTMQSNFDKIQENFRRLLIDPEPEDMSGEQSAQASAQHKAPEVHTPVIPVGRPKQLQSNTPPSVGMATKEPPVAVGNAVLHDQHGKELNLDGTQKVPYRHPNFSSQQAVAPVTGPLISQPQQQQPVVVEDGNMEEWPDGLRQRQHYPIDNRKNVLIVKPTKLNISKFEGNDPESWIQNLEQYFAAARTPIEHRTELAIIGPVGLGVPRPVCLRPMARR